MCLEKYGHKYDYSEVHYKNKNQPVKITCKKHNVSFNQRPSIHKYGYGKCKKCSNTRLSTEDYIVRAKLIHGNRYSYDVVEYKGQKIKIKIGCYKHGIFETRARNHLGGANCSKCVVDNRRLTLKDFIYRGIEIHGDRFNYDEAVYLGYDTKLKLICNNSHIIWQTSCSHFKGNGCIKCSNNISKKEIKWLDYIGLINDKQHRNVSIKINNKRLKVDGINPDIKTIYEFYGDFWHGNPKLFKPNEINPVNKTKFGKLYRNTIMREKQIKKAGFQIISIWEDEFNKLEIM